MLEVGEETASSIPLISSSTTTMTSDSCLSSSSSFRIETKSGLGSSPKENEPTKKTHPSKVDKAYSYPNLLTETNLKSDHIVVKKLLELYKTKIKHLEEKYLFSTFKHAPLLESEIAAKPNVFLIGQYSTGELIFYLFLFSHFLLNLSFSLGKTTFIRNLLQTDFLDMHIGPEPSTDKFMAIIYGEEKKVIQGNALTSIHSLPFSNVTQFGSNFLNKFSASVIKNDLLKFINIIDTPGILNGGGDIGCSDEVNNEKRNEKKKIYRYFAEKSNLILLFFDCSKLDINSEYKEIIQELLPYEDKIHCILNKSDQLNNENLIRVYGALLWSMGRIFKKMEVIKIFISSSYCSEENNEENTPGELSRDNITSFADDRAQQDPSSVNSKQLNNVLIRKDRELLLSTLMSLPSSCTLKKINEMIKRIHTLKIHIALLISIRNSFFSIPPASSGNSKSFFPNFFSKKQPKDSSTIPFSLGSSISNYFLFNSTYYYSKQKKKLLQNFNSITTSTSYFLSLSSSSSAFSNNHSSSAIASMDYPFMTPQHNSLPTSYLDSSAFSSQYLPDNFNLTLNNSPSNSISFQSNPSSFFSNSFVNFDSFFSTLNFLNFLIFYDKDFNEKDLLTLNEILMVDMPKITKKISGVKNQSDIMLNKIYKKKQKVKKMKKLSEDILSSYFSENDDCSSNDSDSDSESDSENEEKKAKKDKEVKDGEENKKEKESNDKKSNSSSNNTISAPEIKSKLQRIRKFFHSTLRTLTVLSSKVILSFILIYFFLNYFNTLSSQQSFTS